MKTKITTIDIQEIIEKRNPSLAKKLKKWIVVFPLIRWIIRERELNKAMAAMGNLRGIEFTQKALEYRNITVKLIGKVPDRGKFIFAANHPLGGIDGLILIAIIGQIWKDLKFLVNDFLLHFSQLSDIFVGINKHGSQSRTLVDEMDAIHAPENRQVIYFAAGMCSREDQCGEVMDLEWKPAFISQAIKHKRDIVPIYVDAKNSDFFYQAARIRKKMGIKNNPEMVLLSRELLKKKNVQITVVFGAAIPYTKFDTSKSRKEWAQWVKDECYKLKNYVSQAL